MIDYSVTQLGKPLPKHRYHIDLNNRVFESSENSLVLDFSDKDGWTFITGYGCTFLTGRHCDFKTCTPKQYNDDYDNSPELLDRSVFITGQNCTFNTGIDCIFKTGINCKFDTNMGCMFITGSDCEFNTGESCTFNVHGSDCIFNTGDNCKFDVWTGCMFNTGSECTFIACRGNYFKTGDNCVFKTMNDNMFECGKSCTYSVTNIESNTFFTYDGYSTIFDWDNPENRAVLTKEFYDLQKVIRG